MTKLANKHRSEYHNAPIYTCKENWRMKYGSSRTISKWRRQHKSQINVHKWCDT